MSFDRLANHYSWMEHLLAGQKLQRCRLAHFEALRPCSNILLVGEGHGRFLETLVRNFPDAKITCLDASSEMLRVARERLRQAGLPELQVQFLHASLPDWQPPSGDFDAIVTNFFLDCFPAADLASVVKQLAESASPDAVWLLADFQQDQHGWRALRTRGILWIMYRFFTVVTRLPARELTPPDPYLISAGFHLAAREFFEWGLLHSDQWVRTSVVR